MEMIELPGATLFFGRLTGASRFDSLKKETQWQQRRMMMFGRMVSQPRLTAWYGDPGASYTYSGIKNEPLPWTPLIKEIKNEVEELIANSFNSVLLNFYRKGTDSIGYHSDNERELGDEPIIASLSYGATRRFTFRHKQGELADLSLNLDDGSLLIMMGETQKNWLHGIDKTKEGGQRINLTFRSIVR
jgi:alkylated DNA repair dioxygenase AlkB